MEDIAAYQTDRLAVLFAYEASNLLAGLPEELRGKRDRDEE